jgi:hypothetical protein
MPEEADSDNRIRDFRRIMNDGGKSKPEWGKVYEVIERISGLVVGKGFERLLLGDHGPYIEMREEHVVLANMKLGSTASKWFDSYYTRCNTQLYKQKQRVLSRDPPQTGAWFANNNRLGGYANYAPGMWYIAADLVNVVEIHRGGRY